MKYGDNIVLKAIDSSIEKYQKILRLEGYERGQENCALCSLFVKDECTECPIFVKTGNKLCAETPWEQFYLHWSKCHSKYLDIYNRRIVCNECEKIIKKEIKFLKEVRKEFTEEYQEIFYYVGQLFEHMCGDIYILTSCHSNCSLVNLNNGHCYLYSYKVNDIAHINKKEFKCICEGNDKFFHIYKGKLKYEK